jgi:hypothetical protein
MYTKNVSYILFDSVNTALFIGRQTFCLEHIAACFRFYTKAIIRLNPYQTMLRKPTYHIISALRWYTLQQFIYVYY